MNNSNPNSTPPSPNKGFMEKPRHRRMVFAMLAIAPVGFIDAAYLTIEHFMGKVPPCTLTNGCAAVTSSPYSLLLGIPLALLGAVYYLAIILGLVYYLDSKKPLVIKAVSGITAFGFVFSLYLVYLQLVVIKAICQYCMLSALSSTLLFILGVIVLKSHRSFERQAVA